MKVKELAKKKEQPKVNGASLVKDLLTQSMSKAGKLKAIKVKVKFGGGEKSSKPKRHVNHGPASHTDV